MTLARRLLALPVALLLAGGALAGCASTPSAGALVHTDRRRQHRGRDRRGVARRRAHHRPGHHGQLDAAFPPPTRRRCRPTDPSRSRSSSRMPTPRAPPTSCPRVTLVEVPEGVDPSRGSRDHGDRRRTTPAAPTSRASRGSTGGGMTDYLPSAGWTDTDGQFVLLTWGSSSCAPGDRRGRGIRPRRGHRHLRDARRRPGLHDGHGPARDGRRRRRTSRKTATCRSCSPAAPSSTTSRIPIYGRTDTQPRGRSGAASDGAMPRRYAHGEHRRIGIRPSLPSM